MTGVKGQSRARGVFALCTLLAASFNPAVAGENSFLPSQRATELAAKEDINPGATADLDRMLYHGIDWPEIWGGVGLKVYATGNRTAPNGSAFSPLFSSDFSLNLGLLPNKKLYVFTESNFWAERASPGVTNSNQGVFDFSKREFDLNAGVAWNPFDRFELRLSGYTFDNLNRGTSAGASSGENDGLQVEGRYYFGNANIYDLDRVNFIALGYLPSKSLIDGDGDPFRPGLFARAHLTWDIPFIRSYLYADASITAEQVATPRLLTVDAGLAFRPFPHGQNLELRLGDDLTSDLREGINQNLVYGAVRLSFYDGPAIRSENTMGDFSPFGLWPEVWGDLGVKLYAAGNRMAPNGIAYQPLFSSDFSLNIGLLPHKQLYLFTETAFWAQRSSSGGTASNEEQYDYSKREFDMGVGAAWNYLNRLEFRVSAFALNNLNRGLSTTNPSGYNDGVQLENRLYFGNADVYDLERLSYVSIGYMPTKTLIDGLGNTFAPGLFARAYVTHEIQALRSYVYGDAHFIAASVATPQLFIFDGGLAFRPFKPIENLEFRFGDEITVDLKANVNQNLTYGEIRLWY